MGKFRASLHGLPDGIPLRPLLRRLVKITLSQMIQHVFISGADLFGFPQRLHGLRITLQGQERKPQVIVSLGVLGPQRRVVLFQRLQRLTGTVEVKLRHPQQKPRVRHAGNELAGPAKTNGGAGILLEQSTIVPRRRCVIAVFKFRRSLGGEGAVSLPPCPRLRPVPLRLESKFKPHHELEFPGRVRLAAEHPKSSTFKGGVHAAKLNTVKGVERVGSENDLPILSARQGEVLR